MNNIAILRRTRLAPGVADAIWVALPTVIAALILTVLLLSFTPFSIGSMVIDGNIPAGGNKINQIGYSLLGIIAVISVINFVNPERIFKISRFSWAVIIGVYLFAIVNSPDKWGAVRNVMLSMIAIITVISVIMLVKDERSLQKILATACLSILGICYFGVFAMPEAARHIGEIFEPDNEGLWRGIYPHKNMAGPIMSVFVFAGIYLLRSGQRQIGIAVTLLSVFFLLQSGSKTSAATVFLVLTIILLPSIIGLRGLGVILFATILTAFATFTIGSLLFKPVHQLLEAVSPGANFTGRLTLWEFAISKIREYPLTGYGLDSLWGKPVVMEMETPYDSEWDFRGIVSGHSSYLDAALELGIPGACIVFFAVIIQPSIDYLRARALRANIYAADFFMMVIVFTSLNAFMETFFFQRTNPVWMMMVLAIAGLRLTATTPLTRNSA